MVPRLFVPIGAGARERQIFQMQPAQVALQIAGATRCPIGAGLERLCEAFYSDTPRPSACLTMETFDKLRIDRQSSNSTPDRPYATEAPLLLRMVAEYRV